MFLQPSIKDFIKAHSEYQLSIGTTFSDLQSVGNFLWSTTTKKRIIILYPESLSACMCKAIWDRFRFKCHRLFSELIFYIEKPHNLKCLAECLFALRCGGVNHMESLQMQNVHMWCSMKWERDQVWSGLHQKPQVWELDSGFSSHAPSHTIHAPLFTMSCPLMKGFEPSFRSPLSWLPFTILLCSLKPWTPPLLMFGSSVGKPCGCRERACGYLLLGVPRNTRHDNICVWLLISGAMVLVPLMFQWFSTQWYSHSHGTTRQEHTIYTLLLSVPR